jgi:hypothetical protein
MSVGTSPLGLRGGVIFVEQHPDATMAADPIGRRQP